MRAGSHRRHPSLRKESGLAVMQRRAQRRADRASLRAGRFKRTGTAVQEQAIRLGPFQQPAGTSTAVAGTPEGQRPSYRALLETVADAYLAVDARDVIQDANPAAA